MRGWLARNAPSGDDGFTLVEMLASLIVIALVASAFVMTFTSAAVASQWNERRTAANQLGQQRLETVVSQPWTSVGLYAAGAGYRATSPDGETTVSLPAGPTVASVPVPLATTTIKQVAYSVRTDITWRDDPADGLGINDRNGSTQDIKHVTISITFGLGSRQKTVTFDGLRGANAVDVPPVTATTGITVVATAPTTQVVTAAGMLNTAMTVTATTSVTATTVSLSFSTRSGKQTVAMASSNGGTAWTVTLPTTTGPFDSGAVTFTANATAASSTGVGGASVNMTASAGNTITVSAAPSQQLAATTALSAPITVLTTSSATIASGTVSFPTKSLGTLTRTLVQSGTSWSYTVPVDTTTYNVGTETFTVSVTFSDGTTATGIASISLMDPTLPPDVTAVTISHPTGSTITAQSFCVKTNGLTLFEATNVDAKVVNVATTDTVQLNAPNYTGSSYYAMSYVSTNADGSKNFRLVVAAGTVFPSGAAIQLKVQAAKTINGQPYTDDFYSNVPIQSVTNKSSCT